MSAYLREERSRIAVLMACLVFGGCTANANPETGAEASDLVFATTLNTSPNVRKLVATTPTRPVSTLSDPLDPITSVSDWTSPATLSVSRCKAPANPPGGGFPGGGFPGGGPGGYPGGPGLGFCGRKPIFIRKTIGWDSAAVERHKVVPSARVRFGPFTLKHTAIGDADGIRDTYRISVWARSPAVYGRNTSGATEFQGAQANLVEIGAVSRTLSGNTEEQVYVTANLPGVFTAFQIRASIGGGISGKQSNFPANHLCSSLPSSSSNPEALDAGCLQAAVNPLAVVSMKWTPLAILYEPPGNCSWSNLTQQHTAGTAIGVVAEQSRSSRVISDRGFYWDNEHRDVTNNTSQQNERRTEVRITTSQGLGTRFGLPEANPGNPQCNVPGADVPARSDGGPGRGDVFILLKNASMIYWDTANMTGSTFSPVRPPGLSESLVSVTAEQIRTGVGLPPGVSFTDEERDALLGLSPYSVASNGTVTQSLSSSRFLPLEQVFELGQGLPLEHSQSRQVMVGGNETLTQASKRISSSTNSDIVVDLSMKALSFGGSIAARAGAAKLLGALGGGFAELADKTGGIAIPELFKDQSVQTVETTFGRTSFLEQTSDSAVTQQFFIQDTQQGISVALYYDALFGTYVFAPHTPGAGWASSASVRNLPVVAWTMSPSSVQDAPQEMPARVRDQLAAHGAVSFASAASSTYRVQHDATVGAASSSAVALDTQTHVMPARAYVTTLAARTTPQRVQNLYLARNAQGRVVAQLWITRVL